MKRSTPCFAACASIIAFSAISGEARPGPRGPYGPTIDRGRPTYGRYAPNGPVANTNRRPQGPVRTIDRSPMPSNRGRSRTSGGVGGYGVGSPGIGGVGPGIPGNGYAGGAGGYGGNPSQANRPQEPGRTGAGARGEQAPSPEAKGLQEALDDIATSWKEGEPARLQSLFPKEGSVAVFEGGQYRSRAAGTELARQVGQGVKQLVTTAFTFDTPTQLEANRYFVSGKHSFLGPDQQVRRMYVSYVLERAKDRWQIVEYGVSQQPIKRHSAVPAQEEQFGPGFEQGR